MRVSDTFLDGMSQRFMCLGYYYSSESGPGSFMATRDELRTVSQYKIEAATVGLTRGGFEVDAAETALL